MNFRLLGCLRRSALAAAAVVALAGMATAHAGVLQAAADSNGVVSVSGAAHLAPGDVINGMLPFTTPMDISVVLRVHNKPALDAFVHSAGTPTLAASRPVMSSSAFMASHAPTPQQVQVVVDFLTGAGFTNIVVAPNRLIVSASGTADVAQAAFQTSFASVHTADGRDAYANTESVNIPATLQDTVLAVLGMQTNAYFHTMLQPLQGNQPQSVTGHNPTEFSSIYGGNGVATAAGVTAGIITQGPMTQAITDLNTFTSNNGLPTVSTQTIVVTTQGRDTGGTPEWDLDSQDIVGMGGGQIGQLVFYNVKSLSTNNLVSGFNRAVSDNTAKAINVSIGGCETSANDGGQAAGDQVFEVADAQGQTFSISTGDSGADECGNGGTTPSWPANSEFVIAAAGTTLDASTTTWNSETVWSGTGGSESLYEPKPSWQTLWSGTHRGVADIAFDANPSSGSKIIVNGGIQQYGGTSLSAPLFVGSWARVIAVKGTAVGFAGPLVYQLPASDFHDVTQGNNGGETAGPGYDLASGRGSMILNQAINHIGGGGGNVPPVANFSFTTSGLSANFTDGSSDSDGTIVSRSWDFGDGGTSTATNPSHTFAANGTYNVSLTVTDNGGLQNTKTESVAVSSGGGGTVLQNGVPVTGLGATRPNWTSTYTLAVPAGASNLSFVISGGTGDADLYVRFGSAPTQLRYDCRPFTSGNNETCSFPAPRTGTYYVRLRAFATFSGVTLLPSYTP